MVLIIVFIKHNNLKGDRVLSNKKNIFMKRAIICICTVTLMLSTTSCGLSKTKKQSVPSKVETKTDKVERTAFEKDIEYLKTKGIQLPDLPASSTMKEETFLSLFVKTYEALGGEIDISKVNSRNESSDEIKKMTLIGVYDSYFIKNDILVTDVDYGSVAYWLMKMHDAVQKRLYFKEDSTARTGDLLRRINVSTALHTWTKDAKEIKTYTISDLLEGKAWQEQTLTRLMAAQMMVSAYEDTCGEIKTTQTLKLKDTDDINAWKSNQLFFWPETGNFEPEKTGKWEDWAFISAIIYDSQLRLGQKLEESKCPYGASVASLASLVRGYEGFKQNFIEEKIVLNERPYNWHVSQQGSGEYSDVNCMPACIEMAMRYQGLSYVPSVEKLRKDNPLNGLGWNDVLAENVMLQYGLKFYASFEIRLDKMLDLLDKGNILYVMYREDSSELGHAVIIKGYRKLGSSVNFIVSDPNDNMVGPFGYTEYEKDAQTMLLDIESHVPRYFIIPSSATQVASGKWQVGQRIHLYRIIMR